MRYSNWLRYINCSRVEEEQNLVAFQFQGKIYHRAYKDIKVGDELLVWYGDEFAHQLGIIGALDKGDIDNGMYKERKLNLLLCPKLLHLEILNACYITVYSIIMSIKLSDNYRSFKIFLRILCATSVTVFCFF